MEHSFSPSKFGDLVNASVTAVNEDSNTIEASTQVPRKMSFEGPNTVDELEEMEDALGDLDEFESLDELEDLEDIDNLDDANLGISDLQTPDAATLQNTSSAISTTPADLKFKTLDQDPTSKILNYSIPVIISKQDNDFVSTSLFDEIKQKFKQTYMKIANCSTYADLWNRNFVSLRVKKDDELVAFGSILAMLYNLTFFKDSMTECLQFLIHEDNAVLIHKLQQINRTLKFSDLENPDASIEKTKAELQTEMNQMQQALLSEDQVIISDSYAAPKASDLIPQPQQNSVDNLTNEIVQPVKKLSKKAKCKLFATLLHDHLLSDSGRNQVDNSTIINESYSYVTDLFIAGELAAQEYVKFVIYLATTKSVNLDKSILDEVSTFNAYVVAVICRYAKVNLINSTFSDGYFLVCAATGNAYERFLSDLLFSWPFVRDGLGSNFNVEIRNNQKVSFLTITTNSVVKERVSSHKILESNLTLMAKSFASKAEAFINEGKPLDEFTCSYTCQDLRFFRHKLLDYHVPKNYYNLSSEQKSSLSVFLAYIETYQPDLIDYCFSGNIISSRTISPNNLSDECLTALYQIIAMDLKWHITNKHTKVTLYLKHAAIGKPQILLTGDGRPPQGILLDMNQYASSFNRILQHAKMSTEVVISVTPDKKLKINFTK